MCQNCFLKGFESFSTWQDFAAFEQTLQAKCEAGQLKLLEKSASILQVSDLEAAAWYQCSTCQETWLLSYPDNAWRGYFLPKELADDYLRRVLTSDRLKSIGCLVLIATTALVLIWKIMM